MSDKSLRFELQKADQFLRQRNPDAALLACQPLLEKYPKALTPHFIMARAYQLLNRPDSMMESAERSLGLHPDHPQGLLMQIEALMAMGDKIGAAQKIATMTESCDSEPLLLGRIAELQTQLGEHGAALATLKAAIGAVAPGQNVDSALLYNLASAEIAVGNMQAAEMTLDRLIAAKPDDYDAYYNRATLRKQTLENNHVKDIKDALLTAPLPPMGEVQLCYALAKEYEDLGEHEDSFAALARGAKVRRANMPYRVEDDINTMEAIQRVFDEAYFAAHTQGCEDARPVFITSLPRSGSTLTDRILSSHPDISSAGEINDLAMLITQMSVGATSKAELIRKSAALDMRELGQRYVNVLKSHDDEALRVIDKTPLNFLYFGLIAKALPNAVIIHVTRDPMDVGYAMFKTLFRMGYPFSYDLDDIAKYMGAKSRLMKHWHAMMPGRIKTVCYEDLVKTQEAASRALVSATGLDWNEACLDFHKNQSASATASAAQVRRPVYNSSLQKWKNYSDQLQPLEQALRTQGILT